MFCPEDGTEIPMLPSGGPRTPDSYHGYYDACATCGTTWWYDAENGQYRQDGPSIPAEREQPEW